MVNALWYVGSRKGNGARGHSSWRYTLHVLTACMQMLNARTHREPRQVSAVRSISRALSTLNSRCVCLYRVMARVRDNRNVDMGLAGSTTYMYAHVIHVRPRLWSCRTHRDEEAEEGAVRQPLAMRGMRPDVRVPDGLPQLRHLEQLYVWGLGGFNCVVG